MAKNLACIALGSNLGDREQHLSAAIDAIRSMPGCQFDQLSTIYKTAAWGVTSQPSFLNAACGIFCDIAPEELLCGLQQIETQQGRERATRWGPRTLDLDIIYFADKTLNSPHLTIPHPLFKERDFVLEPLAEIYPDLIIDGLSVRAHLESLAQSKTI